MEMMLRLRKAPRASCLRSLSPGAASRSKASTIVSSVGGNLRLNSEEVQDLLIIVCYEVGP